MAEQDQASAVTPVADRVLGCALKFYEQNDGLPDDTPDKAERVRVSRRMLGAMTDVADLEAPTVREVPDAVMMLDKEATVLLGIQNVFGHTFIVHQAYPDDDPTRIAAEAGYRECMQGRMDCLQAARYLTQISWAVQRSLVTD